MNGLMKIVAVGEELTTEKGHKFFQITLSAGLGQKKRKRNIFGWLDPDTGEIDYTQGSHGEWRAAVGQTIEARIVRMDIVPEVTDDGQPVNTAAFIAFPDESDEQACKRAGHKPLGGDVPTAVVVGDVETQNVSTEAEEQA